MSIRNAQITEQMLDLANAKDCFEKTLQAYKNYDWDELLIRVIPNVRRQISKALKTHGEQYIINTGRIPNVWEFEQAMPVSAKRFHIFALMANLNDELIMTPQRFTVVRSITTRPHQSPWLFEKNVLLTHEEYSAGIERCLVWAPERFSFLI